MAPVAELEESEAKTEVEPVGLRIALIRTCQRRTARDLAKAAGIGHVGLSKIERSWGVPKLETLERISAALGVTLEEVIKGTEVESKYLK